MKNAPSKFIRDAAGIAQCLGVRLYARGPRRLAQLGALRGCMDQPGFPAKQKNGFWIRAEVAKWGKKNLKVEEGGRKFVVSGARDQVSRVKDGEPPKGGTPYPDPKAETQAPDLFDGAALRQLRLASHRSAWAKGKPPSYFRTFPYDELVEAGIPPEELDKANLSREKLAAPDTDALAHDCNSITEVAEMLNRYFRAQGHSVDIRKQYIGDWRAGRRLPAGIPQFPPPDPMNNRYTAAECIAWYEKYMLPRTNGSNVTRDLGMDLVNERDKAELEEIEHQRFLRARERGDYVRVDVAQGCIAGIFQSILMSRDKFIEDKGGVRRLVADAVGEVSGAGGQGGQVSGAGGQVSGLEALLVALDAKLAPALVAANDALKAEDARAAEALDKQIEEIRQLEMKESA